MGSTVDIVIGVGAHEPVAARLAGRLGRPLCPVADLAALPDEITRMRARGGLASVLVVAEVAVLDLEILQALDAACVPEIGWGIVTGLDDEAVAASAERIAQPPTLRTDDVALLDLFARRLYLGRQPVRFDAAGAAGLFDRPPPGLVLAGHGDGTHATVGIAKRHLVERVRSNAAWFDRIVPVVGSSGRAKSSLVRAGLVPDPEGAVAAIGARTWPSGTELSDGRMCGRSMPVAGSSRSRGTGEPATWIAGEVSSSPAVHEPSSAAG
jgi:hypothetical protein